MDKRCIERNVNDGLKLTSHQFTAVWGPVEQFWGRGSPSTDGWAVVLMLFNGKPCEATEERLSSSERECLRLSHALPWTPGATAGSGGLRADTMSGAQTTRPAAHQACVAH